MPTSGLPDFGRLSLGSPSQDVFQNQIPHRNQIDQTSASVGSHQAHQYNAHQSNCQQPQGHFSHPVATAFPRPENMATPSRNITSAPRTPDPAAMPDGAFAGMALNDTFLRTSHGVGVGSVAFNNTLPHTPQDGGRGLMAFNNVLPRTPQDAGRSTTAFNNTLPRTSQGAGQRFNNKLSRTLQGVGQGSMAFNDALSQTPQDCGKGTTAFNNALPRIPQSVGQESIAFSNTISRTPQGAGRGSVALNSMLQCTPQEVGQSSMTLLQAQGIPPDHGFSPKLDRLFQMIERYCYSHLNFPSAAKDGQLHPSIKERLMKAASRESAHQLGSTGSTRYFLMTKVVLQWMLKHVFTPNLFAGFDFDADRRIAACKDHIFQDTPPLVKYQLLCEISKEIRQIRGHPSFPIFLDSLVRSQGNKLWAIIRPLMHQTTAMDWEDLRILMFEAYSVAGDMTARPYEWRFDFAEIGSTYNASMINRDPYLRGQEEEIANRGLAVRLGFIPAVSLRDNTDGRVRTEQITRQQVLLKS